MRIRSIRPEFWASEDIAALEIPTRLLFIGIWSYVDDNGVGRDVERLIRSELFPLEEDTRETLAIVSRGLQHLSAGGQITRYTLDSKHYLHVTAWETHQRVDRPGRSRYPLPTRDDAVIREIVATPSRDLRDTLPTGEGEKGRSGEVNTSSSADADAVFAAFWLAYPKKVSKQDARKRWDVQIRKTDPDIIIEGAKRYARHVAGLDPDKIKNPDGWILGQRWCDDLNSRPLASLDINDWMNR